ncbi:hypothetical protein SK128_006559 [Halocaridina rubra]|uniref:Carbohydrate sulfotransferase n=1 Tax=Halocaridina rubra TaxID=373956 RepID=A0AAN8WIL6_HALRR
MKTMRKIWGIFLFAVALYICIYLAITGNITPRSTYFVQYVKKSSKSFHRNITKRLIKAPQIHLAEYTVEVDLDLATEAWSSGWESWMSEQERRQETVRNICEGISAEDKRKRYQDLLSGNNNKLRHLLVDEKHKAIYCYIPMAKSGDWRKLWMVLIGLDNNKNIDTITTKKAITSTSRMRLTKYTKKTDDLIYKLETYTKIMVVRHPIERLILTYLDKIDDKNGQKSYQRQVLPFVQKKRPSASLKDIEWSEFIEYATQSESRKNEHWVPFYTLCRPCQIDYDVIVKTETFEEDSERFLELIGAPEEIHFSRKTTKLLPSLMDPYLKDLSVDNLKNLYKYFGIDFALYEYEFPSNITLP